MPAGKSWIVFNIDSNINRILHMPTASAQWSGGYDVKGSSNASVGGPWGTCLLGNSSPIANSAASFTFEETAVASAGTFTSQIIDTGMIPQAQAVTIQNVGTNPMSWGGVYGKSGSIFVEQADSDDMLIGLVASTPVVDPTQTQGYTFALTKRYWRIKGTLQTNDDRYPAQLPWFYFRPPTDVTWELSLIHI